MIFNQLLVRRDSRAAIVGQTGTGKTSLALRLLPRTGRLAIIDPKRGIDYPGTPVYSDPELIIRDRPDRFIYRPHESALDDIEQYDRVYRYVYETGNITVYTDDVVGIINNSKGPHYLKVCYMMGRAKTVRCIASFQRPSSLPLYLMSEAAQLYVFRLTMPDDIKRARSLAPGYDPSRLKSKYHFHYWDADTQIKNDPIALKMRS